MALEVKPCLARCTQNQSVWHEFDRCTRFDGLCQRQSTRDPSDQNPWCRGDAFGGVRDCCAYCCATCTTCTTPFEGSEFGLGFGGRCCTRICACGSDSSFRRGGHSTRLGGGHFCRQLGCSHVRQWQKQHPIEARGRDHGRGRNYRLDDAHFEPRCPKRRGLGAVCQQPSWQSFD